MITFFRHVGVGIISALTAFTGAFHQQIPAQATSTAVSQVQTSPHVDEVSTKGSTASVKPIQTGVAVPSIQPTATTPISDYALYSSWPSDFSKNPPYYVGTKTKVSGVVVDFMAAGDRGGSANYVEIAPSSLSGVSDIALQLSSADYQTLVKRVNKYDTITAYGVIMSSQTFLNADQFTTTLMPVLQAVRVDLCGGGAGCNVQLNSQTVFPVSSANTISKSDRESLGTILQDESRFINTQVATYGKVIRILQSPSTGDSMIFIQDSVDGRGLAFFTINTAFVADNNIGIGTNLLVDGTVLSINNSASIQATKDFYSIDVTGYVYISSGTINIDRS